LKAVVNSEVKHAEKCKIYKNRSYFFHLKYVIFINYTELKKNLTLFLKNYIFFLEN